MLTDKNFKPNMKLLSIALIFTFVSCSDHNAISPIQITNAKTIEPHVIISSSKSTISKGEKTTLVFTLVNPTNKRIPIPFLRSSDNSEGPANGNFTIEWKGIEGDLSWAMIRNSVTGTPPTINYLEPNKSLSFYWIYESSFKGEGEIQIEYTPDLLSDCHFHSATIRLKTK
jgi:hypothetical protein